MGSETDVDGFVHRYVAVWNEPDPVTRRAAVAALWAEDGVEFTDSAEHRGHRAIEDRVTEVHERFISQGGFVFRSAHGAVGHHGLIRFTTHLAPADGGEIAWTGFVVAELDDDGRIRRDHQFADPPLPRTTDGTHPHTQAVVDEFLRRTAHGTPEQIAELYAETVDWRVSWPEPEHPAVPWIRHRSTRADVADHFRTFEQVCPPDESEVRLDSIVIDGRDAILFGTSSQLVKPTRKRFTMTFALRLTVSNGMITRHHMYEDSLAVAEAFALTATGKPLGGRPLGAGPGVRPGPAGHPVDDLRGEVV